MADEMPSKLFISHETGELDTDQILVEAIPIAKLIGLFVAIAIVPLVFAFLLGDSMIAVVFALVAQFVLSVGAGIVLLYVVFRAIRLADEP